MSVKTKGAVIRLRPNSQRSLKIRLIAFTKGSLRNRSSGEYLEKGDVWSLFTVLGYVPWAWSCRRKASFEMRMPEAREKASREGEGEKETGFTQLLNATLLNCDIMVTLYVCLWLRCRGRERKRGLFPFLLFEGERRKTS